MGKTSLVSMLSSGGKAFPKNYKMTSSPELMSAAVTSEDGTAAVEFLLLDTAGAEVFADLSLACLADSYHVALVYDVSSRDSFLECQRWLEVVQKGRSDPRRALHAVLIANKADLPPARHTVTQQEGADWAAHNHCTFFQIAASPPGSAYQEPFQHLAQLIVRHHTTQLQQMEAVVTG